MKIEGNTVLITGGATGIGLALAEEFVGAGSEVIVCGRHKSRLHNAKRKLPAVHIRQCDVSVESERKDLLHWSITHFPHLNMLVNNAGIQRQVNFMSPAVSRPTLPKDDEVSINLFAPIRLCALFTPKLMKRQKAAIINISSGLAFVPIAAMPIYCATKSSYSLLHNLTTPPTQRHADQSVRGRASNHRH